MQQVIRVISTNIEVEFKAAGIHKDSFSCMDFSIQKALQELGEERYSIVEAGNNGKTQGGYG